MAITEERLQELIKQEAMVYRHLRRWEYDDERVEAFKLNKTYYIDFDCGSLELCSRIGEHLSRLDDLYEHEHDAIHASKYVDMERVERLSLPFWSEIEMGYLGNGLKKSDLFHREIRNKSEAFAVYINLSGRYIEIIKLGNSGSPSNEVIFNKPLTQENYTEACRLIKKLFMGEE